MAGLIPASFGWSRRVADGMAHLITTMQARNNSKLVLEIILHCVLEVRHYFGAIIREGPNGFSSIFTLVRTEECIQFVGQIRLDLHVL